MSAPVRLPRKTARAIDRLARHAHAFHRLAHHPLCERYGGELVRLGRRARVCRGCLAVALGAPSGVLAELLLRPGASALFWGCAFGALLGLVSLRLRLPKILGRFLPAASVGAAATWSLTEPRARLVGAALALGVALFVALYRARRPDRSPCATCPERHRAAACSGFSPIVRRERAFQRLAGRLIRQASISAR
jgi:hypothetical protein